jgi:hypothetical protein
MSQRDRAELERWVHSPSMPAGLVMRCGSCWAAVDRHHRGRRYAPAGLIEYVDAGGPVVPVAPARHRATPALRRRERDRVNKPALVESETSIGRMR